MLANTRVQRELLQSYYNAETAGHIGVTQTLKALQTQYYQDSIYKDIKKYFSYYTTYQQTKIHTHYLYSLLAVLLLLQQLQEEISIDIITGIPPSINPITTKLCNIVLVIIDRFTKYTLYIPLTKSLTSNTLAKLIFYYILHIYSLPIGIVLDYSLIFTSNFQRELYYHLTIKQRLSTTFYL